MQALRSALSAGSGLGARLQLTQLYPQPSHTHFTLSVQALRSALSAGSSLGARLQQVTRDTSLTAAFEGIAASLPSVPPSFAPMLARLDKYQVTQKFGWIVHE